MSATLDVFETGGFCPDCGSRLVENPAKPYPKCPECSFVRYRNPVAGVAVVIQDQHGYVLMGQRASGIYAGLWCIPCGYVEWGEEIREAAKREFLEETGLLVETHEVVAVHSNFHNPKMLTVGTWFRGTVTGGELHPVDGEFSELAYCDPAAPPPLAFPTDALVLEQLAKS
jgi:8-oxo-dGTP diphosphatase